MTRADLQVMKAVFRHHKGSSGPSIQYLAMRDDWFEKLLDVAENHLPNEEREPNTGFFLSTRMVG